VTYLVDTDWVVDYLKGRPEADALLEALFPAGISISIMTYAEVFEGIYYGSSPTGDEATFRAFLEGTSVLGVSQAVAERYAHLAGELRSQGLLMPAPDLLIAATSLEHDLILATRNTRHYNRVPGLNVYSDTIPPQ